MALAAAQAVVAVVLTQAEAVLAVLEHLDKVLLAAMEITALMVEAAAALVLWALMPQAMLGAMAALELLLLCRVLQ